MPSSISLTTDDESSLSSLLEGIAGFAIIEKATMRRAPQLRTAIDVGSAHPSYYYIPLTLSG